MRCSCVQGFSDTQCRQRCEKVPGASHILYVFILLIKTYLCSREKCKDCWEKYPSSHKAQDYHLHIRTVFPLAILTSWVLLGDSLLRVDLASPGEYCSACSFGACTCVTLQNPAQPAVWGMHMCEPEVHVGNHSIDLSLYLLDPELTCVASLASQLALGIHCHLCRHKLKLRLGHHCHPAFVWVFQDSNSGHQACSVSASMLSHLPNFKLSLIIYFI